MPQIINTNIASINAQRNLDRSQSDNQQALQRLSSGLRINSAKDDAAGLAISTRFTSQIKGLNVATRNAGDGIALAQTAEGALGSINDSLQRIRELAVQSANATNSDVDRDALQAEVDQLVAEITRTSEETDFNGRNLLDGSFAATFQIGANAGQTVDISIAELTSDKLGSSAQSGLSAIGTDSALENGDLTINGVAISASRAEDDTSSVAGNSASAISKAAAINRFADQTGVTAQVNENVAGGSEQSGVAGNGTFTLNGVDISFSTTTDAAQTRAAISQAINAVSEQTGVQAVDTESSATGVNLVAEDGRNITLSFDTADFGSGLTSSNFAAATGLAGGATNGGSGTVFTNTYEGGYTLIADGDRNSIEIGGGNGTGRGDLANAGLTAGTYDRGVASSVSESKADTTTASTNAGGSLNNTLKSNNLAGTFVSTNSSTIGTNLAAVTFTSSEIDFTIAQGTTASAAYTATAADLNAAALADSIETAATTAGIDVDFFELGQFTATNFTDGTSFQLGGVTINASGTSAALLAESVQNQINAADFSAVVGSDGFVRAELNSAGDEVNVVFKNQSAAALTATNLSNGSAAAAVQFDTSGGAVTLALTSASASQIRGEIAFTSDSEVSVVTNQSAALLDAAAGVNSYVGSTTKSLSSSQEVDISVTVGGEDVSPSTPLAADSTVAQLANTLNGVDGVRAYEEITLNINSTNLDIGESLRFSDGTNNIDIAATPDDSGNVTLQSLADDINRTDASSAGIEISAVYKPAEGSTPESLELVVRNFSANTITLESENADGAGIAVSEGGGTFIGEQAQALSGELKFSSEDGRDVNVTLSDPTTGGELFAGKSQSQDFTGVNGLEDGDILINGVTIGGALTDQDTASATVASDGARILSSEKGLSAIAVAAAINEVADETGVTASVNATKVVGGDGENADTSQFEEGDQAGLFINGVNIGVVTLSNEAGGTTVDKDRARADALNLINQNAGKTGVTAEDNGVSLTLTAADGRNVSIAIDDRSGADASIGALFGLDAAVDGIGEATFGGGSVDGAATSAEAAAYETTYGTVKLDSAKEFTLSGGANGNDELGALGLAAGTYGGGEDGQFLSDIDISTFEGATAAITAIDNAIGQVASQRADLGAIQNRLESTVSNLQITSENLNAANSRIQDADFAAETAELQRTNVLQQAGISVLAQANAAGQQVLSLLG